MINETAFHLNLDDDDLDDIEWDSLNSETIHGSIEDEENNDDDDVAELDFNH